MKKTLLLQNTNLNNKIMKKLVYTLISTLILISCGNNNTEKLQVPEKIEVKEKTIEKKEEVKELDVYDFLDFTEKYKGQIFEWKMEIEESIHNDYSQETVNNPYYDFKNETLQDYVGKTVMFDYITKYGEPNVTLSIFIPENLVVPKATYGNSLMVKFKCGGDLKNGNTAISITRDRR